LHYRPLGNSGLKVSVVSLGCNNFGDNAVAAPSGTRYGFMNLEQTRAVVDASLDAGINFFDTADVYGNGGSERLLGEIFRGRRQQVIIATKWGSGLDANGPIRWGTAKYIGQALDASLQRLQTDYVDLYQMHWPDPRTPIDETLAALTELKRAGKIRAIGSSHLRGWQVADTDWLARNRGYERFVSAQNHYSMLQRGAEAELLPACAHFNIGLLPYFPLENGLLTGKYRRHQPTVVDSRLAGRVIDPVTYDVIEALEHFAAQRGHSLLELAIAALAARPAVASVITGATRAEQIRANAAAADWQPDAADMSALDALLNSLPAGTDRH
jgi:aryl-alcohol dehydrogenase-like predicted oxidoreductase